MPDYTVSRRDPARIARAVIRYQLMQPRVLIVGFVVLIVAALLAGTASGWGAAALTVIAFLVVVGATIAFKRRQLERTLARRGYRPGTAIGTSFDAAALTVRTVDGTARHAFAELADVRSIGGVVILRMQAVRFVVALPAELVPPAQLAMASAAVRPTTSVD